MFKKQKELDKRILDSLHLSFEDTAEKKRVALLVELGETLNEWKGFKFWAHKMPNREKLVEEYVDVLHFLLSFGNDFGAPYEHDVIIEGTDVIEQSQKLYSLILNMNGLMDWFIVFGYFRGLAVLFGIDWEEVVEGYYKKNEINHVRQDEGY